MAVTETATATEREIGTGIESGIRNVTAGAEIGTGIRTRIRTAGIATATCGTRKGMSHVAAGAPTASTAHPRHLSRRMTILGPHFLARVKILACRPPAWIKKNLHCLLVSVFHLRWSVLVLSRVGFCHRKMSDVVCVRLILT